MTPADLHSLRAHSVEADRLAADARRSLYAGIREAWIAGQSNATIGQAIGLSPQMVHKAIVQHESEAQRRARLLARARADTERLSRP